MGKLLEILVPQYNEDETVICNLLDSIKMQQGVDFSDYGVIIVNDGSDCILDEEWLKRYPFDIKYCKNKHTGISGARNKALELSTAKYVMFCDADDMFFSACGLNIITREMKTSEFDSLSSTFVEECYGDNNQYTFVEHKNDSTFIHGKIFNREYLNKNNIKFDENLSVHEDSCFVVVCQRLDGVHKYCNTAFYLWKYRENSVCRRDDKYLLKTYKNFLDSNDSLVSSLLQHGKKELAQAYITSFIYGSYYTMNKDEWCCSDNIKYRKDTEKRFKQFYLKYHELFEDYDIESKAAVIKSVRTRMFEEGLLVESITFKDWIKRILAR